jgi:hypothetical protein
MNSTIYIVDYSEKSIALFGDTKPIKEELKNLGGRFNYRLVDPAKPEEKSAGWVFPLSRKEEVYILLERHLGERDAWGDEIHQEDGEEYFKCTGICDRVFYYENTNEDGMCGRCELETKKKRKTSIKK